jgi:hypothetical protein
VVSVLTTSSMLVPDPYMASAIAASGDVGRPPIVSPVCAAV